MLALEAEPEARHMVKINTHKHHCMFLMGLLITNNYVVSILWQKIVIEL